MYKRVPTATSSAIAPTPQPSHPEAPPRHPHGHRGASGPLSAFQANFPGRPASLHLGNYVTRPGDGVAKHPQEPPPGHPRDPRHSKEPPPGPGREGYPQLYNSPVKHIKQHRARLVSQYKMLDSDEEEEEGGEQSSAESGEEEEEEEEEAEDGDDGNENDNDDEDDDEDDEDDEDDSDEEEDEGEDGDEEEEEGEDDGIDHVLDRSMSRAKDSREPVIEDKRETVPSLLRMAPLTPVVNQPQQTRDAFDKAFDQSQPANTLGPVLNARVVDTTVEKNDGPAAPGDSQEITSWKVLDPPPEEPILSDSNFELPPDERRGHTTLLRDAIPYAVAGLLVPTVSKHILRIFDTPAPSLRPTEIKSSAQKAIHRPTYREDVTSKLPDSDSTSLTKEGGRHASDDRLRAFNSEPESNADISDRVTKLQSDEKDGKSELTQSRSHERLDSRQAVGRTTLGEDAALPLTDSEREDPSSQNDKTNLWSAHIESDMRLPKSTTERSELVEYGSQDHDIRGLPSEPTCWDEWHSTDLEPVQEDGVDACPSPLDHDETLPQSPVLQQMTGPQHGTAEENDGLDNAHAALRLIFLAAMAVPILLAFSDGLAHSLFSALVVELVSDISLLFLCVLFNLCVCGLTYASQNDLIGGLLRVLILQARGSMLVFRHNSIPQGVSTAQSQQSADDCPNQNSSLQSRATQTYISLRKLSGSALGAVAEAARQYTRTPVPLGMKRIRWQCRCGKSIDDDYVERKAHALQGLAETAQAFVGAQNTRPSQATESTQRSEDSLTNAPSKISIVGGVDSSSRQHGQDSDGSRSSSGSVNSQGSSWTSLGGVFGGFKRSGPTLPQHGAKNGIVKSTKIVVPPKPDHLEFLLLCVPFQRHANKLLNIDTTMPPASDKAFYSLLRQTYATNRGRFRNFFSIRALSEIRFVQFEVFRNDLADVRKFDCIPPEAQKDNYLYRPMPAEFEPPIGKNQMRHLYDHPDHADDLPVCYSRVPRKLRERLFAAPGIGRSDGWGICFIEGVSWPRVCALGLAGVLASTIFGVVWTLVQEDIQGGFGVASYMLGVLVLGLGALQGAFEM
jgi:hypothetical protein